MLKPCHVISICILLYFFGISVLTSRTATRNSNFLRLEFGNSKKCCKSKYKIRGKAFGLNNFDCIFSNQITSLVAYIRLLRVKCPFCIYDGGWHDRNLTSINPGEARDPTRDTDDDGLGASRKSLAIAAVINLSPIKVRTGWASRAASGELFEERKKKQIGGWPIKWWDCPEIMGAIGP